MNQLSYELDDLFQQVILRSENQLEFLIGDCKSEVVLTNTQEHILMLIDRYQYTSSEIAKTLKISQAAVTKAVKSLVKQGMLESVRDLNDARVIHYSLTDLARPIANEHASHHHLTLESYDRLLSDFSEEDQAVISCLFEKLRGLIEEK